MKFKIPQSQFFFFSFILILISFSSCSIKKRSYRKGYHVDWVYNKAIPSEAFPKYTNSHPIDQVSQDIVKENLPRNSICAPQHTFANRVFASGKPGSTGIFRIKPFTPDTCGDMIYLKAGTEFTATIIELTEEKVRYRRCDKNRNEILEVKKDKVLMIRFSNGKVESYNEDTFESKNPPVHPLAVLSFVSALCSLVFLGLGLFSFIFLFFAIAALLISSITAYSAKKKIMANVGDYKGFRLLKATRAILWTVAILTAIITLSIK